ncbi:Polysaccharide biosynthesis protein [Rubripirellula tenax]|uniref:Polysaccharide biosynthesis protein n=1 Tax=Rubripirellula tenax TaxID=2528015 RepID=A0A5C6FG26_9BACT|nr:oligosaccharide flippase family protein [Rubripirellula tenax]TWU59760.1 Polysaccharide biosynthesis protein [Rubripirellula tenax]
MSHAHETLPTPDNIISDIATDDTNAFDFAPVWLIICNVVGVGIGYAITIVLARNLPQADFEQYIGAIATLGLLSSLGEAGFGKFGLKAIPQYVASDRIDRLSGYVRFAIAGTLLTSLVLALAATSVEHSIRSGLSERVMDLGLVFLPAMALFGVAIDLMLAFRYASLATTIARIAVPIVTLAAIGWVASHDGMSARSAVVCFAGGSLVGMVASTACVAWISFRHTRSKNPRVPPTTNVKSWILEGVTYMAFGFSVAWFFRATLVIAHHVEHIEGQVALLGPAMETGCLILLLSKSTDKYFQPTMSEILTTNDYAKGVVMKRRRHRLLAIGIAIFMTTVVVMGKPILGLYGQEYRSAYAATCVIAAGSSVWTYFSIAPIFLLFAKERRRLLINLLGHAVVMGGLTIVLFRTYGVLGAAIAYCVTVTSLSLINAKMANRRLDQMQSVNHV